MDRRSVWVALLATCLLLAPSRAGAETTAAVRAEAHYKAGSAFLAIREYDKAIVDFLEAYRLLPLPDLLFNIGQTYRMKGTPADRQSAAQYYRRYLKARPEGAGAAEAREHLAAIERDPPVPIVAAPPAPAEPPARVQLVAPPPPRVPLHRRPALWGGVAAALVVVVVGVTVGVVVSGAPRYPNPTGGVIAFSLGVF